VPPRPDAFIVNIGDMLSEITRGAFRSPPLAKPAVATATLNQVVAAKPSSPPASPAVAAPTAAASPGPPSPATSLVEPLVVSLDRQASSVASTAAVEALWGGAPVERTLLRTHFDQLRRFDLPVVLEMFHPTRKDTCFLALLRLDGDVAEVTEGEARPLRVAVAELDRLWTRQAIFLWKDYDAVTRPGTPQKAAAWVREQLAAQGYLGDDPDLGRAVARFQRDHDLAPDGVVGARTLMTLYTTSSYPRPRLRGGA